MDTNTHGTVTKRILSKTVPMNSLRKTSLTAGVLYLLTFVSIPTLSLYGPIHKLNYVVGPGTDNAVITGGILEIVVALTAIGTAVALYPVLRKESEVAAVGLIASRVLEASTIFTGVAFLFSVVTLRQNGAGASALPTSQALVILYDRIFLLGQGFMPAMNDLLLGAILYKSRLVSRALSVIGMVGALPLIAGYIAVLSGFIGQHSVLAALSALPVAVFEFSLGVYLVAKGFRPSTITNGNGSIYTNIEIKSEENILFNTKEKSG